MSDTSSSGSSMERLKTGFSALSTRFRTSGAAASKTLSEQMTAVGGRVKEYFQAPTPADKYVDEATAESLEGPNWEKSLQICDLVNAERLNSVDVMRGIKRRILVKNAHVQLLALNLLETSVKNCVKMFAEISSEKVLDEMVRIVDDPIAALEVRNKCLTLIEAWGEATEELRYLPVFEETYKSLKSRGVRFPGRDNESLAPIFTPPASVPVAARPPPGVQGERLAFGPGVGEGGFGENPKEALDVARNSGELLSTVLTSAPPEEALKDELTGTLVSQCNQARTRVQHVVETAGDNETLMFEALSVLDELDKVLAKYEELKTGGGAPQGQQEPSEGPAALVAVPAGEEDEESATGDESEGLLRNRGAARPTAGATGRDGGDDAEAMAHLDEMIFGKKDGSEDKKKDDDMIVF